MNKIKNVIKYLFVLVGVLLVYSVVYEPYALKITSYNLENSRLSGIKIVFVSDFHVARHKWEKWRLQKIIDNINEQNPDLVILGGDYVNRHSKTTTMLPKDIVNELMQIRAPKVAVLGNHDSYYGKKEVLSAFENAEISVLDNRNIKLNLRDKEVYIAGVSDYDTDTPDIEKALKNVKKPLIFVTHSPDVFVDLNSDTDVVLAGHTHGGQIVVPFLGALVVNAEVGKQHVYGLSYKSGRPMIVSSGLGTSIVPVRFNNLPEIVVVNFISQK